ncbi:LEA type 2 family protein, partial [Granulosicoccus sp.]
IALLLLIVLSGCATLSGRDAPSVSVVGLNVLPSEGLELRFALKLRVQNPNETPLAYDGLSVKLDLDGRGVASGVSNESGEIQRFSDKVLTVPVSISAFAAIRQLLARAKDSQADGNALTQAIEYSLRGKLGAVSGGSGATRFSDKGALDFFATGQEKLSE